jgi:hypothetical protein
LYRYDAASSNAALASEAADRLRQAEGVVENIRRAAAAAEERVQRLEADASRSRSDAAAAARDKENSLREQLSAAEQRYERLRVEAEQASANATRAMQERDQKIQALQHSLTDLEAKSNEAVVAAQNAVASAEHARFNAEDAAASAAADAAATYMRLEASLSHAEQELRSIESVMADEQLKATTSSRSYSAGSLAAAVSGQGNLSSGMRALQEAEQKMEELEVLGKQLLAVLGKAGIAPSLTELPAPPKASDGCQISDERSAQYAVNCAESMVEEMEFRAAKLWAQLESAGIDPAENLR